VEDKIGFFCNLLNLPFVFNTIRTILDGGQVWYISRILNEYRFKSVFDVCCGCGAFSRVSNSKYTGIDCNEHFIRHAKRKYGLENKEFCTQDIHTLESHTEYDVSIIISSIHHFSNGETVAILRLMRKFTKLMILIHDLISQKNVIS
jgi:2-polyprenyl-3-methyl-5-hydroxy-6-metoxy-1,4-benzoquinol methylase